MEEINNIYKEYKDITNLSCNRFKRWSKNPCSYKASLSREPIKRNIQLLCKSKSRWDSKDIEYAKRTINYLQRSSGITGGKIVEGCGKTKNEIARMNWARED